MKILKSKNSVKLIKYFEDEDYIYLVMEYCEGGNLYDYIIQKQPKELECLKILI